MTAPRASATGRRAPIVGSLVVACVVVFLWQSSQTTLYASTFVYRFGFIPAVLLGRANLAPALDVVPPALTVLTSLFLHGSWTHLVGNLLYLWLFGKGVEPAMGAWRFAVFYLLCGAIAVCAHASADSHSTVPLIGASGAVSGVLGAYLRLFPRARIRLGPALAGRATAPSVSALAVLGVWFAVQVLNATLAPAGPGIAFAAHAGGFVAGLLLAPLFARRGVAVWHEPRR